MSKIVIALGGNAISPEGEEGNIDQQFRHTGETMSRVVEIMKSGFDQVLITHGNGPQIGNILLRSEMAASKIYPLPLDTCVADSIGGMGYMIAQALRNALTLAKMPRQVACVVTQTEVRWYDPEFDRPTKPIGQFLNRREAMRRKKDRGWKVMEDAGRGYRRVVPSPIPLDIVEREVIRSLFERGVVVVACGGGGIPVVQGADGRYQGVEAVVDKDLASALLGKVVGAETLLILTSVGQVALRYGQPDQENLSRLTLDDARRYLAAGEFPPGSMGPKIEAAIHFLEGGGREVIITTPDEVVKALEGEAGTRISRR